MRYTITDECVGDIRVYECYEYMKRQLKVFDTELSIYDEDTSQYTGLYEKDIFNVGGAEGEGLYRFLLPDPTCSLVEREPATERLVRFLALDGCSVCPIGQRFVTVG